MASPEKLAHVVLWTRQLPQMRDWYLDVLQARVVHENPALAFLTYDDEHHRIALTDPDGIARLAAEHGGDGAEELAGSGKSTAELPADLSTLPPHGLMHIAFTYASLLDLLENYERLTENGIKPVTVINHGTTTSLYYADPDGNNIELQIDNFDTADEGTAFMESDSFRRNPVGVPFDPDEMLARLRAGESQAALVTPTW
ncbi:VOC family protein [Streptomyces sp. ME02-8801-2C]|uniref:VOC family protein n=1 Tax=Streptomyces sp. ME02-8801-2C TaxID=3028680 RepID=UPI00299FA011|nr:VOC family protein [Streptomyces sp. ME02-8801-2C]MDX3453316.1 VOC family protein [Streptomyces sp. ME02-8801-2C]